MIIKSPFPSLDIVNKTESSNYEEWLLTAHNEPALLGNRKLLFEHSFQLEIKPAEVRRGNKNSHHLNREGPLTVHVDGDAGEDRLGVVVVVPATLQAGVHVLSRQLLQLHGVPALAWRDLLPAGVQHLPLSPPADAGARPAWNNTS